MPYKSVRAPTIAPLKAPPRGRPSPERVLELEQAIIATASSLMLQYGYDNTSLEAVAKGAGVTKRTIYSRFGSKEDLLQAVLLNVAKPTLHPLPALDAAAPLQVNLMHIARSVNSSLLRDDMQRWLLFTVVELAQRPKLISFVHELVQKYVRFIERLFRTLLESQPVKVKDIPTAARFFAKLISEPARNMALFAIPVGSEVEQEEYLRAAVEMFTSGLVDSGE